MRERPIIFSAPMVRAILDGRKTQTRRVVKSPARTMQRAGMVVIRHRAPGDPWYSDHVWSMRDRMGVWGDYTHEQFLSLCPYGVPGDRLWVRETFLQPLATCQQASGEWESYWTGQREDIRYVADGAQPEWTRPGQYGSPWRAKRPSIHMPRWASRIMLEITDVRVERPQDISEEDARAEGFEPDDISRVGVPCFSARQRFADAWRSIYGPESWDANPWCWALSFRRLDAARGGGER
jgi:hypothetical protein